MKKKQRKKLRAQFEQVRQVVREMWIEEMIKRFPDAGKFVVDKRK